jgi:hypothetical protein
LIAEGVEVDRGRHHLHHRLHDSWTRHGGVGKGNRSKRERERKRKEECEPNRVEIVGDGGQEALEPGVSLLIRENNQQHPTGPSHRPTPSPL